MTYALHITHHASRISAKPPHGTYHFSLFTLYFSLLIALLFTSPALAQSPLDAEVDFFIEAPEQPRPITVGDQIKLRLQITHPADSRVVLPQLEPQWESFVVVDQTPPQTIQNDDGSATTGKDITVALFRPGQYETPPIVVTHRKPDGSVEELAAPVIQLTVTSVLTEESELQDLKPQAELRAAIPWAVLAGMALVSLLVAALAALGLWLYRRRQRRLEPELIPVPFMDTRPPEIVAYAELDRIEALDLPAQNRIKEHYSLVALCLRRYIEGRYKIPAVEQTTTEMRDAFVKSQVPLREISGLMGIITESDLVKFARYIPQREDTAGLIGRARTVIDATTPHQHPEPPPPAEEPEEVTV